MKKALFTCLTGILLTWIVSSVSYSQTPIGTPNPKASDAKFSSSSEELSASNNLKLAPDEINAKAVKSFTRDFKNAPDAKWYKLKDGLVVHFENDGIKTRVFYTKKGRYEAMIRSYFEDRLPREIRHLVKSTYYDFNIYHVNEVNVEGITAYLIKMEDKTSWKTIKVINGEMQVVEDYQKR